METKLAVLFKSDQKGAVAEAILLSLLILRKSCSYFQILIELSSSTNSWNDPFKSENYSPIRPTINRLLQSPSWKEICVIACAQSQNIQQVLEGRAEPPLVNSFWNLLQEARCQQPALSKAQIYLLLGILLPRPEVYIHTSLSKWKVMGGEEGRREKKKNKDVPARLL